MGPTSFIMVLIGCAPGGSCEPIATLPVAYASQSSCLESRAEIVEASTGLGYARVVAECRPQAPTPRAFAAGAPTTA